MAARERHCGAPSNVQDAKRCSVADRRTAIPRHAWERTSSAIARLQESGDNIEGLGTRWEPGVGGEALAKAMYGANQTWNEEVRRETSAPGYRASVVHPFVYFLLEGQVYVVVHLGDFLCVGPFSGPEPRKGGESELVRVWTDCDRPIGKWYRFPPILQRLLDVFTVYVTNSSATSRYPMGERH